MYAPKKKKRRLANYQMAKASSPMEMRMRMEEEESECKAKPRKRKNMEKAKEIKPKMCFNKCKKSSKDDEEDDLEEDNFCKAKKNEEDDYDMLFGEKLEEKKLNKENVEFSNKELVITQDIVDGFWNLNPQTKLLIEKQKLVYDKIEKYLQEKNLDKEEIKVTLLVLYYLTTDTSINKIEYSLIIKKGEKYLQQNGINVEEALSMIKK